MKILLLLFFLTSTFSYSQKQFEFDYIMEYDVTLYIDSTKIQKRDYRDSKINTKSYYLTNSKHNEYYAVIREEDSLNYNLIFQDHEKKLFSRAVILKSELNDADLIDMNCRAVRTLGDPILLNNFKKEDFELIKLKDTVINKESFFHYAYRYTNLRKNKRKKMGTYYFIMDKSSNFDLPLFKHLNLYEIWLLNKTMPMGLIKERYYIDYYGKLIMTEKLNDFIKTGKKINMPKGCGSTEIRFE